MRLYRIGQFAALSGLSIKTLRYYDELRILTPTSTDPSSRYRFYSPDQLLHANQIIALRSAGIPLAELRKVNRSSLERARSIIKSRIADDERTLRHLDALLEFGLDSVAVKIQPPMRVVALRQQLADYDDVYEMLREVRAAFPTGATPGVEGALWHSCKRDGVIDCEAFVTLSNGGAATCGKPEIKEFSSVRAACVAVTGGDEEIEGAYGTLFNWFEKTGNVLSGARCEWYHRTSEGEIVTEVRLPYRQKVRNAPHDRAACYR